MSHYLPNVVIRGHSFVRRLNCDLNAAFDSRPNTNFELSQSTSIHLHGVEGRTVEKLKKFDLSVLETFKPDILLLEIGTNYLSRFKPETVGSLIEEFILFVRHHFGTRVIAICEVIDRNLPNTKLQDVEFNAKAAILRQYLSVVLAEIPSVFIWKHIELSPIHRVVLLPDGVHLNSSGQYFLYRSYRGAVLKAIKLLRTITEGRSTTASVS